MSHKLCLICGNSEDEVEKMHCFPSNDKKSKLWQEAMGMKYMPGDSLRNSFICCRHFTQNNYLNLITRKLRVDAVPSLFPCNTLGENPQQVLVSETVENRKEQHVLASYIEGEAVMSVTEEAASCSGLQRNQCTPNPIKRSVFRNIKGLSKVGASPRKKQLMRIVESKEAHIRKLKILSKKRAGDIKALTDIADLPVARNLFAGMSTSTADFLISQLRCARRSPHGRRWSTQEKVLALALLKKSPRCYRFLRKIVALPSRNTLLAMLQKIPFHSGINEHLFKHIANSIHREEDKYCALLFDEMDIKEHVQYDKSSDRIVGFEELGGSRTNKLATKALTFMLQGVVRNWKQPVAFFFCSGACPSSYLQTCIVDVHRACEELAKVHVVTTICDMGSTNVKALKEMGSSVYNPYVVINNKKVFTMYDPPHLLKCTVSLFRKHNVMFPVELAGSKKMMEARFADIVKAHKIDQTTPLVFRALHKIKSAHLAPVMQFAMKVNIAAQVMSHTVAAFVYALLSRGELEQRAVATATFVQQVDELFDSFNGSRAVPPVGKELKCCISEQSKHFSYWKTAFQMIKDWQFQRWTKGGTLKKSKPPPQVGWLTTLNAIGEIWTYLHQSKGVSSMRPRALNQDALENLFGAVRGGCGSGDNPTPIQFIASLKTQILNGLTRQTVGSNCEEDENDLLTNLNQFLVVENEQEASSSTTIPNLQLPMFPARMADDIADAVEVQGTTVTLSVSYVSGFIVKRILEHLQCDCCRNLLLSTPDAPHNLFIGYKEWSQSSQNLKYPSEPLVVAVGYSITMLEKILDQHCNESHLTNMASKYISENVSFSWLTCSNHKDAVTKEIILAVCRIGIPWWCKRKNREVAQARKEARANKRKLNTVRHC